ncbi:hypothetical protein CROQUDRAFT_136313 [Cronartium quercuum f. sp. fusiforme G11]|uniref:Rab-GAP TBC domain-containing protein n=1 Tax=Cronartium quercuum f. sp. fusiforme G11 TaxID=708437 RepID=A0A9P6NB96_9BASI|nr:hypothetical protein CROQUDRAFT_136313 [Cronartium quercuum f. sp. fusiforme G11]
MSPSVSQCSAASDQSALSSAVDEHPDLFEAADNHEQNEEDEDDFYRPFNLRSIEALTTSSPNQTPLDSFSRPSTPPLPDATAAAPDLAILFTPSPVKTSQGERLLTGPSPVAHVCDRLVSSPPAPSQPESPPPVQVPTHSEPGNSGTSRQDSTTSTVWRSSLVPGNDSTGLPSMGLQNDPFTHKFASPFDSGTSSLLGQVTLVADEESSPCPLSSDSTQQVDRILPLASRGISDQEKSPPSQNLTSELGDQASDSPDMEDLKRPVPSTLGLTHSDLSSPDIQPTALFTPRSFNALVLTSPDDQDARRQSVVEGLSKLRQSFSCVQEEMMASSTKGLLPSAPVPDEPGAPPSSFDTPLHPTHVNQGSKSPILSSSSHLSMQIDWDFWGSVMNDYEQVAKEQPKQLSRAIQSGIPPVLRGMMWQLMSSSKDADLEAVYSQLLSKPCPHEKAIGRDLSRTYPQLEYFQEGGLGQDSLLAVCKAFSLYDPEVGYTQGLQFIIGPMLLNMPDEEAFCVLVRLMNSYDLRSHFIPNMPGLQLRLFQFDRILEDNLPHVHLHLLRQGIKSSMYASQWFLTLFGYRFPLELVSVVMDLVFAEGLEAVFRFALCLMKKNEHQICALGFDKLLDFLKLSLFEPYQSDDHQIGLSALTPGETRSAKSSDVLPITPDGTTHSTELAYPIQTPQPATTYRAHDFIKDALQIKITPLMLDQYASEWDSICKERNAHSIEIERLRQANTHLSAQVRRLESNLAQVNQEHCELVKQVVMAKLDREELEDELVKYKMAFAEMSHQQASEGSKQNRGSVVSLRSFGSATPSNMN